MEDCCKKTPPPQRVSLASASFRDSDIEFLQIRAREWLETILGEKLDERQSLADLLADGSLLYRVSQIIREFMQRKAGIDNNNSNNSNNNNTTMPTKMRRMSPEVGSSKKGKNNMKYLPYSYVETFLKLCRDVGLADVDVFNAPDAIDKKDIRRICMCIRRLSKEARSQHLPVPDFDVFKSQTKTSKTPPPQKLAMSTDLVGGLRESLEKSPQKLAMSTTDLVGGPRESLQRSASKVQTDDVPARATEESSTSLAEIGVHETPGKAEKDQDVGVLPSLHSPSPAEGAAEAESGSGGTGEPVLQHCDNAERSTMMMILDGKLESLEARDPGNSKAEEKKTGTAARNNRQWSAWLPMAGGVAVFLGTLLAGQMKNKGQMYEVKEGDTLAALISRPGLLGFRTPASL